MAVEDYFEIVGLENYLRKNNLMKEFKKRNRFIDGKKKSIIQVYEDYKNSFMSENIRVLW